jgi:hypothetical protein
LRVGDRHRNGELSHGNPNLVAEDAVSLGSLRWRPMSPELALPRMAERVVRSHDRWRLQRFRQAYVEVSGHRSPTPGYRGLIEEMRWGLEHLDARTRERADDAVLYEAFYGAFGLVSMRWLGVVAGDRLAPWLARAAPITLRFLVGEIETRVDEPAVNVVPECRFRRQGGESLCREVCQGPTEAFTRARGLPVVLEPRREDLGCRWTWGRTRTA